MAKINYVSRDKDIYKEGEENNEYTFLDGLLRLRQINETEPIICRYGLLKISSLVTEVREELPCEDTNFFAITNVRAGMYYFYNLKYYKENGFDECRLKFNSNDRILEAQDIISTHYSKRIDNPRYESEYKVQIDAEIEAIKARYNNPPELKKDQAKYKKQMNDEIREVKHRPVPEEFKDTYVPAISDPKYKIIDIIKIISYWNCKEFNLFTREQCEEKYYETLQDCQQNPWIWNNKGFIDYITWMKVQ